MKKNVLFIILITTFTICRSQVKFTPSTFNPVKFNPVYGETETPDASILRNSLKEREDRRDKAIGLYSELAELAASYIDKLYQDEETLLWYQRLTNPMLKEVKGDIDDGNYGNAIINAATYKTSLLTNAELRARVSVCEEYYSVCYQVNNRSDLSPEQKQNWFNTYKYKFVPIINGGKIIGAKKWMEIGGPNDTPVILP